MVQDDQFGRLSTANAKLLGSSWNLVVSDGISAEVQLEIRKNLWLLLSEIPLKETVRLKSSACSRFD